MKRKSEKGITLVALVITIILMLILAGVAISFALGENGLIKIAKQARNNYINAQEQENILLGEYEGKIKEYAGDEVTDHKEKAGKVLYKNEEETLGATTINIDGSKFNLFQIVLKKTYANTNKDISIFIKKGENQDVGFSFKYNNGSYYCRFRNVKISLDGTQVIFGNAYQASGSDISAPLTYDVVPMYVIGYNEEEITDIFN